MRHRVWTRVVGVLLLGGLIGAGTGCGTGQKGRAVVKGQVTFNGKPLTAGTVLFMSKDNRSGTGTIDQNGNYTMNDAPIGDVTITVTVPKMPPMMGGNTPMTPGRGVAMKAPDGSDPVGMVPATPAIDPSKIVQIPEKYSVAETSGLTFKVEKGEQPHDIKLIP